MELGLYTFADVQHERGTIGNDLKTNRRFKELLEEIKLADEAGLDVFGIGEHHREDYAVSSPAVVLGAAAAVTKNIKLSSAVTVLSSDDPVRVFQDFATIDQLSSGRAEIMVGRGSFIESFPLFGYDLDDYDRLFEEKLELLLQINKEEVINWNGQMRSSISNRGVYPRPYQQELPIWLAVGGTPASAVRAGTHKLPMALAIIGGPPDRFVPFVNLYKESAGKAGKKKNEIELGINSHVYIAETSEKAASDYFSPYAVMMNKIGRERGWQPLTRDQFDFLKSEKGSLVVGSPQQAIDKIMYEHSLFGNTRFLAQMSIGNLPHEKVMRSIELFAIKVAPEIRRLTLNG